MKILLTGSTGFIGRLLVPFLLNQGHDLTILKKDSGLSFDSELKNVTVYTWHPLRKGSWNEALDRIEGVIHLAGAPIAEKRWTSQRKQEIQASRIESTKVLVQAFRDRKVCPRVWCNASAVGFYGDSDDRTLTERGEKGNDFLADVCEDWEKAALEITKTGTRAVFLRFGMVLGKSGGALQKMLPPFQIGAGAVLGSGKQWVSWVHREDAVKAIHFILDSSLEGPVNVTSPHPIRMKEFCVTLSKVLHRPCFFKIPPFALQMMLGELSHMLITGQKALPHKLMEAGFTFQYPSLKEAFQESLSIHHPTP